MTVSAVGHHEARRRCRRLRLWVDDSDEMRGFTWTMVTGVVAALVLAVIGGLPFALPMPTHAFGWVEPTCGLTRGSISILRGQFDRAWRFNPAAFLVLTIGMAGVGRLIVGAAFARWVNIRYRPGPFAIGVVILAIAALWVNQQHHAGFIIRATV